MIPRDLAQTVFASLQEHQEFFTDREGKRRYEKVSNTHAKRQPFGPKVKIEDPYSRVFVER